MSEWIMMLVIEKLGGRDWQKVFKFETCFFRSVYWGCCYQKLWLAGGFKRFLPFIPWGDDPI